MGAVKNNHVFKGVAINGQVVKGLAKGGVTFYKKVDNSILNLDFQNNFIDTSSSSLTMVAGGNSNPPTFALSGRKAGEYCAVFNGSQSIKTTTNLPVNSDKVTIAFWMKTSQTNIGVVVMLSNDYNSYSAFTSILNDLHPNRIYIADHTTSYNIGYSSNIINDNNWHHIAMTIDRSQNGINQNRIYVDGNLAYSQNTSYQNDLNGLFSSSPLFIGQGGGSSLGFIGSLTRLKIYNYPLTAVEVSTLYNSE